MASEDLDFIGDEAPTIVKDALAVELAPDAPAETAIDRRTYIGGSDAYRCLNDRLTLYQEKAEGLPPADLSDVELVQWGKYLEPIVAAVYAQRTGNKVRRYSKLIRHPKFPWMGAHVDRILEGQDGGLEVKTAGATKIEEWGEEGSADIPPKYYFQVQHYICVTRRPWFDLPVLFGGQRMPIYHVTRDERFITDLVEIEREFWRLVEAQTPPEPISSEEASRRWPTSRDGEVQASYEQILAAQRLAEVRAQLKQLKTEDEELCLILKAALADHGDTLMAEKVKLCTWKTQESRRVDLDRLRSEHAELVKQFTEVKTMRVLRLAKEK